MYHALSRLMPRPQEIEVLEGHFDWGEDLVVVVEPDNEDDRFAAQTLEDACRERNISIPQVIATSEIAEASQSRRIILGDPSRHWPLFKAMKSAAVSIPPQAIDSGYALHVSPERILLASHTREGVYYGIQTLIQLLPRKREKSIRALKITDWAALRHRGFSMDLFAGEVYDQEMMKETIKRMAHYKMNMVVLYLEDAFLFPSHPEIGEDRDRLTTEEALELVAFGRKHHVEIVPCYDSPGHMGNTLRHPKYQHLSEADEGLPFHDVINLTHPDAYPFLRDLYTDLFNAFPCEYHYMAGDEAFGMGRGKSAGVAAAIGREALYLGHVRRMRELFRQHGKRIVLSGDPFEPDFFKVFGLDNFGIKALKQVPRDAVIAPWHYNKVEAYPFGQQLKDMGFEQHLWTKNGAPYKLFPSQNQVAENVESFIPYAHQLKALGVIHSDWNRWGANTFFEYNWPAYAYVAEWEWTDKARTWEDALPVAVETFYGPGTARLAEVIFFLADLEKYFEWGKKAALDPPDFSLFFKEMEPEELNLEKEKLLAEFRKGWHRARDLFDGVRHTATRNRDHLLFLDFVLDQQALLGDMIECRHLMARVNEASKARLKKALPGVRDNFSRIMDRYEVLWQRVDRPLGLELNKQRFKKVADAIERAIKSRNESK